MERQPVSKSETSVPVEAEFHQDRFERLAQQYENSFAAKFSKLITDREARLTGVDFAQEEANRDNTYFERKKDEEFEAWEKDLKVVTDHIAEKIACVARGESAENYRPLILTLGGGMKGTLGAGQALVGLPAVVKMIAERSRVSKGEDTPQTEIKLDDVFTDFVGISAGAPTMAYAIAGGEQMAKGASIFYEECTEGEFVKRMPVVPIPTAMNIDVVTTAMADGEKSLDQQKVKDSKAGFHVVVTNKHSGECEILDAKTAQPGMMNVIAASMAVPMLYRKVTEVNGQEYVDGAFSPVPLKEIIDKFSPTDILILPQVPFDRMDTFLLSPAELLVAEFSKKFGSLGPVEKFVMIKKEIRDTLEYIKTHTGVNIGVLWPPDFGLNPIETDPDKIKAASLESARGVITAFGLEQPSDLGAYSSPKK